jgi:hypothetical protein
MDWQAWRKALELYLETPELIVASILVAIAIFGFAWWLHSHTSKERIATLQDRLRLGKQVQEHITNQLDSLKLTVSRQEAILNAMAARLISAPDRLALTHRRWPSGKPRFRRCQWSRCGSTSEVAVCCSTASERCPRSQAIFGTDRVDARTKPQETLTPQTASALFRSTFREYRAPK